MRYQEQTEQKHLKRFQESTDYLNYRDRIKGITPVNADLYPNIQESSRLSTSFHDHEESVHLGDNPFQNQLEVHNKNIVNGKLRQIMESVIRAEAAHSDQNTLDSTTPSNRNNFGSKAIFQGSNRQLSYEICESVISDQIQREELRHQQFNKFKNDIYQISPIASRQQKISNKKFKDFQQRKNNQSKQIPLQTSNSAKKILIENNFLSNQISKERLIKSSQFDLGFMQQEQNSTSSTQIIIQNFKNQKQKTPNLINSSSTSHINKSSTGDKFIQSVRFGIFGQNGIVEKQKSVPFISKRDSNYFFDKRNQSVKDIHSYANDYSTNGKCAPQNFTKKFLKKNQDTDSIGSTTQYLSSLLTQIRTSVNQQILRSVDGFLNHSIKPSVSEKQLSLSQNFKDNQENKRSEFLKNGNYTSSDITNRISKDTSIQTITSRFNYDDRSSASRKKSPKVLNKQQFIFRIPQQGYFEEVCQSQKSSFNTQTDREPKQVQRKQFLKSNQNLNQMDIKMTPLITINLIDCMP